GIRDRNVTGVQTCALPIWFGEGRVQRVPGDVLHPGGEDPYGFAAQLPFQARGEFPGGGERAADVDRRSHDDRVVIQRRHRIDITSVDVVTRPAQDSSDVVTDLAGRPIRGGGGYEDFHAPIFSRNVP